MLTVLMFIAGLGVGAVAGPLALLMLGALRVVVTHRLDPDYAHVMEFDP